MTKNASRSVLPKGLLREAFEASREKNYFANKFLHMAMFGSAWRFALLGYAYLKIIDNAIDEDEDVQRALAFFGAKRAFMRDVYAGRVVDGEFPVPDRFGYHLFCYDRENDSYLRPFLDGMLDTMEFDLHRRNRILSAADLNKWAIDVGSAWLGYLGQLAARGPRLPKSFLEPASLAYIWADSIIDVEKDLRWGIISVSEDDIKRFGLTLDPSDSGLDGWINSQSEKVMGYFESALAETQRLKSRRMRVLANLYLRRKRKQLSRFVERRRMQTTVLTTESAHPQTAKGNNSPTA
ncbi:MAG: squalene/phytoene synthase family protein [Acidiferrobacterales bacterium]